MFWGMKKEIPGNIGKTIPEMIDGLMHWPCPTPDREGTMFLHKGTFGRGLGLFSPIAYRPSEELPDDEYSFFSPPGGVMPTTMSAP